MSAFQHYWFPSIFFLLFGITFSPGIINPTSCPFFKSSVGSCQYSSVKHFFTGFTWKSPQTMFMYNDHFLILSWSNKDYSVSKEQKIMIQRQREGLESHLLPVSPFWIAKTQWDCCSSLYTQTSSVLVWIAEFSPHWGCTVTLSLSPGHVRHSTE